jgi:deoxycytidine triphosphate deaminase
MATILSDREIKGLLRDVIAGGDPKLLNPNGIELRLGCHVRFHSTGEECQLQEGYFLKVSPGETVLISSLEKIDFTRETVQKHFPHSMLMAFITPTTTMMREGISQVATKIDAGFRGALNWGLRNGSAQDLILQFGEPIFKVTIFRLDESEKPDVAYGEATDHKYQDTEGIVLSRRRIPASLPKNKILSSGFEKLDPKKQLREAGYPFDHIGTELIRLDGKFEMVSKDVAALTKDLDARTQRLTEKIESETASLVKSLGETKQSLLDKVEMLFDRKFVRVVSVLIGAISILYGGLLFLQKTRLEQTAIAFIAVVAGLAVLATTWLLARRQK